MMTSWTSQVTIEYSSRSDVLTIIANVGEGADEEVIAPRQRPGSRAAAAKKSKIYEMVTMFYTLYICFHFPFLRMKAPTLQDQISLIRSLERTSTPPNQRTSQDPRSLRLREPRPRSSPLTTRRRRCSPLTPTKMSSTSQTQMVKV